MSQRAAPVQHLTLHCKLTPADSCTQSGGCPAQAIAAPLGAALLKFLPARHLESMVSALMVLIMGLMNRQTLQQWATAGWHRLTQLTGVDVKASCTSASGCSSSSPLWEPSLTLPGSPLSRCVCVWLGGGGGRGRGLQNLGTVGAAQPTGEAIRLACRIHQPDSRQVGQRCLRVKRNLSHVLDTCVPRAL